MPKYYRKCFCCGNKLMGTKSRLRGLCGMCDSGKCLKCKDNPSIRERWLSFVKESADSDIRTG